MEWWKAVGLAVFAATSIFWGGYTYFQLGNTTIIATALAETVNVNGNRITALEANLRGILTNLQDIKIELRNINAKLDRK